MPYVSWQHSSSWRTCMLTSLYTFLIDAAVVWIYNPFDTCHKKSFVARSIFWRFVQSDFFFFFQASDKGWWLRLVQQLTSVSNWVHHQHHRHHHLLPYRTPVISSCLQTYEIVSYHWKQKLIFWLQHTTNMQNTMNIHHQLLKLHHCHKLHSLMLHHHYCKRWVVHTVMIHWIHCWAISWRKGRPPTNEVYQSTLFWYVAVPCRNRKLFRRIFWSHRCVRFTISLNFR